MSGLPSLFKIRNQPTEQIIELLDQTVLGTNGAMYRHTDTRQRIKEMDNPIYLTAERNNKVLGNITFCQRNTDWYIRYFAFKESLRSSNKRKSKPAKGLLKEGINHFFEEKLQTNEVNSFYAYIDPGNDRSLIMSNDFGFKRERVIATQTYSRRNPKTKTNVIEIDPKDDRFRPIVSDRFKNHSFFHPVRNESMRSFVLLDNDGKILAGLNVNVAHWEIIRLPGRFGNLQVKLIPYIPVLRRIIVPKNHRFAAVDNVFNLSEDAELLNDLFEGTLNNLDLNSIFWWVDIVDPTYLKFKNKLKWGPLHRFVGVNEVYLMSRRLDFIQQQQPAYVLGLDFI